MSITCSACGTENPDAATTCMLCDALFETAPADCAVPAAVLSGSGVNGVRLAEGMTVTLGRLGQVEPIAAALNWFDDVGRDHAHITLRGAEIEVEDQNSKHGTWVNGEQLTRGRKRAFELPVDIRLGRDCVLRIEWSA